MSKPARLSKSESMSWEQKVTPYVPYILLCLMIVLILLLIALVCTVMGVSAHSLTGTEANNYYYGLEECIR